MPSDLPHARKSLGQNFLTDQNILRKEARLLDPKGKAVLEIGPGDGRLSERILELMPKRLFLIEKDERMVKILNDKFCGCGEQVIVIAGDVLEAELPEADVVAGNIPYYITSPIIFRLARQKFERAVLIVQKEFAQRMAAKPGDRNYGRLSVTAQLAFDVELVQLVPRHLFRPAPKVDSALIILKPTGRMLTAEEENIIRYLFSHKNKTVRNALLDSKMFGKEELEALGKYEKRKVRTLTKEEVLEISRAMDNKK
jgi:16S rRNA (adenine1518-N6/adenine1519-N6)-dimethyltransferase